MRHDPASGAIIIMAHAVSKCTAWLRRSASYRQAPRPSKPPCRVLSRSS